MSPTPAPVVSTAAAETSSSAGHADLVGCVVGVTSDRRSAELSSAFERRGASVLHAPTLRIMPLAADDDVREATRVLIETPPDDVIATTAIGFRGWMEAADTHGMAPELLAVLGRARILSRGPKARGAVRAAGLTDAWAAESEVTAEVVDRLLVEGVAGRRIAVQLHGASDPAQVAALRQAGADVVEVPVYRWGPSPNPAAVERLLFACATRAVDAVVFTSAPGAEAFLAAAAAAGQLPDVVEALSHDVVAAAVGNVTAGPLVAAGIPAVMPDRFRLGALVRTVAAELTASPRTVMPTPLGPLEVRALGAVLDGCFIPLPPGPAAVLRTLVRAGGDVVDRRRLAAVLPGRAGNDAEGVDQHAVEVAVGRLRSALSAVPDGASVLATVVKRGYRLVPAPVLAAPGG